MTKEEYEKLLKSDYWKGYSYSLIKERNFTCQDCGRRFYNERNKLQVHHLVYRDVNPWSYNPDELIVLCEECHKKRHGISQPISEAPIPSPSLSSDSTTSDIPPVPPFGDNEMSSPRSPYQPKPYKPSNNNGFRYLILGLVLLLFIIYGLDRWTNREKTENKPVMERTIIQDTGNSTITETPPQTASSANTAPSSVNTKKKARTSKQAPANDMIHPDVEIPSISVESEVSNEYSTNQTVNKSYSSGEELSTLEMLERRNHEDVVKRAKEAGVSTEGSTIDILERINHADVVKRAKQAGVSTEGSTIDILERINHADVVKRAKQAGVSTEGSTIDILERINHADVVKRAKQVGVSTEGSTIDILERITRKELERRNY